MQFLFCKIERKKVLKNNAGGRCLHSKAQETSFVTRLAISCCSEKHEAGRAKLLAGVLDSSVGTTHFLISDPIEEMTVVFLLSLIRA